jgi:homoserine dehydrogenase
VRAPSTYCNATRKTSAPRRPRHRDHDGRRGAQHRTRKTAPDRRRRARSSAIPSWSSISPEVDIVVELIGGYELPRELVLRAIPTASTWSPPTRPAGLHGNEIFAAAQEKGVMVAFEAAVAGGVPIIKALREGLTANRIESVAGIINGTTNFILSEMRDKGLDFARC